MAKSATNGNTSGAETSIGSLDIVRIELVEAERELTEYRKAERPLLEKVQRLRRAERELMGGELASTSYSDVEIVGMIRDNSSAQDSLMTSQIAELMGGNGKGYARRLKRMAEKDQMIAGNAAEGYYVPGYDHGRKLRQQRVTT